VSDADYLRFAKCGQQLLKLRGKAIAAKPRRKSLLFDSFVFAVRPAGLSSR
jgi:hypothetical protein